MAARRARFAARRYAVRSAGLFGRGDTEVGRKPDVFLHPWESLSQRFAAGAECRHSTETSDFQRYARPRRDPTARNKHQDGFSRS